MSVVPKKWTRYLPYLRFYLDVPLLTVQTEILLFSYERLTYDIIRIFVKFWRWQFNFDLYKRLREF